MDFQNRHFFSVPKMGPNKFLFWRQNLEHKTAGVVNENSVEPDTQNVKKFGHWVTGFLGPQPLMPRRQHIKKLPDLCLQFAMAFWCTFERAQGFPQLWHVLSSSGGHFSRGSPIIFFGWEGEAQNTRIASGLPLFPCVARSFCFALDVPSSDATGPTHHFCPKLVQVSYSKGLNVGWQK